jgi:hypothetical protein
MAIGRARIDRLTTSSLILLAVAVTACGPAPIQSPSPTSGEEIDATATPSKSPDACADGSLTVRDGRSLGRASIIQDLDPFEPLGTQAKQLEERWNGMAPPSLRIIKFDTVLLYRSDDRTLEAELGTNAANEPLIAMLVPIDDSDQVRSIGIRWRRPVLGQTTPDLDRHNAVLAVLVEATAAPDRRAGAADCVLQALGSFSAEDDFAGIDRQVEISSEEVEYRLLEVDSVIWFTASRSGP